MRALGFGDRSSSAGAIRIVRRRAAELGIDWSHFRGKRQWSDAQLRLAVAECLSWNEVLSRLGLSTTGGMQPHIKSHTVRLGLDTGHLNRLSHDGRLPSESPPEAADLTGQLKFLRTAAGTLAATWFSIRGFAVSLPIEPVEYDLLVRTPSGFSPGGINRVQVKTTTFASKDGWTVGVGHHPDTHSKKGRRLAYDPDEIDLFFIVDGDMTMYLIPSRALAERVTVVLRTYRKYMVGNARGLLGMFAEDMVTREECPVARVPA